MNVSNRITFGRPKKQSETQINHIKKTSIQHSESSNPKRQFVEYHQQSSMKQLTAKVQLVEQRFTKKHIFQQLNNVYQSIYDVIFLKQAIMSLLNQQKLKMSDFFRDIKKYIFQIQIKLQRTGMDRQSKIMTEMNQSKVLYESCYKSFGQNKDSMMQAVDFKTQGQRSEIQRQNFQLQTKCQQLIAENEFLKQQYQIAISKYQQQINYLMQNVQNQHNKNNLVDSLNGQISFLKQVIQENNQILKNQQLKYKEKIKHLENQIICLQEEYIKEKQANDRQLMRCREKQKMYMFQESQLQRKNILLIQRQRSLFERQTLVRQELHSIQRRQNKVSDYQHNQMRRQKQLKELQRNNLRNQYYGTMSNIPISKQQNAGRRIYTEQNTERERSTSSRHISNGLNINARLKEIQQQKRKLGFNGVKASRTTQINRRTSENRSVSRDNYYSKPTQHLNNRQTIGMDNVGTKLTDMLSSLQKQLNDIK